MAPAMCMAVAFMLAIAVVKANQCSSGGECPSDDEPQNLVSQLQTKLRMNVLKDGPSMTQDPSATGEGQPKDTTELKCTEALQQQVDGNKDSRVKAYNLMSPELFVATSGFPGFPRVSPGKGRYTSDELSYTSGASLTYRLPDSQKSCPQQMQKNIHFIWFGKFLPDKFAKNIAGVAGKNPAWTVMLWTTVLDTEALTKLLNSGLTTPNIVVKFTPDYLKDTAFVNNQQIIAEENPAAKSDFMRLEVVYKFGGIYIDTDTVSHLPFDDFGSRFQWPFVVFDHGSYANLCNCGFGAEAGSKFLLYWIKVMAPMKIAWSVRSCGLLTDAFVRYNQTAIQMFSSDNMLHPTPGYVQVQTQSFEADWLNGDWHKYQDKPLDPSA